MVLHNFQHLGAVYLADAYRRPTRWIMLLEGCHSTQLDIKSKSCKSAHGMWNRSTHLLNLFDARMATFALLNSHEL